MIGGVFSSVKIKTNQKPIYKIKDVNELLASYNCKLFNYNKKLFRSIYIDT